MSAGDPPTIRKSRAVWLALSSIALVALGAIGWAAALQSRAKNLEKRVEGLEARLGKAAGKGTDADATATSARHRSRGSATAPAGTK